jgi:predicted naringenin-chalcone synthase
MVDAFLNRIATAVPDNDVHETFVTHAPSLLSSERDQALLRRMSRKAQIEHRYSFLSPDAAASDANVFSFYRRGAYPDTATRMRFYEQHAFSLARRALDRLEFAEQRRHVTHLIVTTCTGFYAPGLDLQVIEHYGLNAAVERTVIGFMGCYAAINALKMARHIVRSEPQARVAILNLELCTIHLQDTDDLEQVLSFLIFADGCAASLVTAEPKGLKLQSFHSTIIPSSAEQITWHIGGTGFDMVLMGSVPGTIARALPANLGAILGGAEPEAIAHWAVHPGGRTILDAVESGVGLAPERLQASRGILRRYGNMSSASIMFVLQEIMQSGAAPGLGCGMAFGPGLTVESLLFQA